MAEALKAWKKKEAATKTRNKLEENTQLMSECNELRQENITLRRKVTKEE